MKSLQEISGLDISLAQNKLKYDTKTFPVEPKARTFEEAKSVYQESVEPQAELYYMYRFFERTNDHEAFEKADAEYDLTLIKPGKIGEELIKTKGHYHAQVPGTDISYPEVYEVLEGEVEYLIQTKPNDKKETDVVIIKASVGDKIVVPPNYGHVSVNTGTEALLSANIQKRDLPAGADYGGFEYYKGGAMYRTQKGWEENPEYVIRSLKYVKPKEKPEWGLSKNTPLYTSFIQSPEKFGYITKPQDYDFSDIWLEIN